MKILVTNSHSVRNAGDRVLLAVTLEELRANFPGCDITVAINSMMGLDDCPPARYVGSFMSWFKVAERGVERWNWRRSLLLPWWLVQLCLVAASYRAFRRPWPLPADSGRRELLSAYGEADLVVSCPGNFFYSGSGLGLAFLLHALALAYGGLLGKPLYMMPQTIGPLTRRRERWVLARLLTRLRWVALRDDVSLGPVTALGVPASQCRVLPDTAFLFAGSGDLGPFRALGGGPREGPGDLPRPYLGVTVIDWAAKNRRFKRQAEYERAVAGALTCFLDRHGGTVFIFPQVTGPSRAEDDRIPAARITALLGAHRSQVVQIDSVWSPDQLRAAYGQMDGFLGARLHSCIFALTAGTSVLAVAYQYKTHGVLGMLGLGDWVVDIEDASDPELAERLESLWLHRADVAALIERNLPPLQQDARQAAALIAADFARLSETSGRAFA